MQFIRIFKPKFPQKKRDIVQERQDVITEFVQIFNQADLNKDGLLSSYEEMKALNDVLDLGLSSVWINQLVCLFLYTKAHFVP